MAIKVTKLKLQLTKKQAYKMGRVKRWEDRSAEAPPLVLGPRKR